MAEILGLDVGGTNLRLGVFKDMQLIHESRFKADYASICRENTPAQAWQTILQSTAQAIEDVLSMYPNTEAIGIGFPGFINPVTGVLAKSPNLSGLEEVSLAKDLTALLARPVIVENDANAAAYGEYCLLGRPAGGLLYVGLGTGVGGGLVLNGQVYKGSHGYAMEIGHIQIAQDGPLCGCGNKGCLEQYASASAIKTAYFNASQQTHSAHEVASLARWGDMVAMRIFQQAAQALAQVMADTLKLLDVSNIVIGGGLAGAWDVMKPTFDVALEHALIPILRGQVSVAISSTLDTAGMLGAALLATDG